MSHKKVTIINKLGLHARASSKLVQLSSKFASEIHIKHNDKKVNGKSIMGVMMLAASQGTEIELIADGNDQQQAIQALEQLIQDRFGEQQ